MPNIHKVGGPVYWVVYSDVLKKIVIYIITITPLKIKYPEPFYGTNSKFIHFQVLLLGFAIIMVVFETEKNLPVCVKEMILDDQNV